VTDQFALLLFKLFLVVKPAKTNKSSWVVQCSYLALTSTFRDV